MNESIEAGAPDIKYNRGDIRMGDREPRDQGKEIAAEIWSQMEPEQKVQFQSFESFFKVYLETNFTTVATRSIRN